MRIEHALGRTITQADNMLFCALTMNAQPLHLDEHFAAQTQFGARIVNGLFTLGPAVELTMADLTAGMIITNLGYDNVRRPRPMFHGDTLYVTSEVLSKRDSRSNPRAGVVRLRHIGRNQRCEVVIEFERTALFRKRNAHSAN